LKKFLIFSQSKKASGGSRATKGDSLETFKIREKDEIF